ncbi:MAG: DoxX family protein [Parcubacteria group bacterium]|nr:DoxX family protein [Parcubacteria group bacterium]
MKKSINIATLLLRLSMAWYFLYAGISKLINPLWSAAGYLNSSKTFPEFYAWLASPENIEWVNFLNEWGLTLVGILLALGLFTRAASFAGALMLLLYYFPILSFPYVGEHFYIVDSHVREILVFVYLIVVRAGMYVGLDELLQKSRLGSTAFFRWIA